MIVDLGYYGAEELPARWDLAEHPHSLIAGQTGSGKTYLLKLIIEQAARHTEIWLADGKASNDFDDLVIDRVAKGPVDCVELLEEAGAKLAARNSSASAAWPLLVVVDEAAAITLRIAGDTAKDARERKDRLLAAVGQLALMGRSAGVHLLVALQRPDANILGGAIRDQFGLRVALGWLSCDGYRMMFGEPDLHPPLRPMGNGWCSGLSGSSMSPAGIAVAQFGPR